MKHLAHRQIVKLSIHRCSNLKFLEHRKKKTFRQCEKPTKFGANGLEVVEIHPPIPIWDLDAWVAGKQRIYLHCDLAPRLEMKLKIPRVEEKERGWEEF
ncbi:hypothetical protein AVEN_174749-1 [Araneus ventricosus]|uniref:Uncharacterized protein n=1 Tax=Araneus ventricosus TaxID=182803 RepID=A0A4Y2BJN6_ARAVE|nr:hypothetical protein AVEN_174749-1 [Araneus ventricosus]